METITTLFDVPLVGTGITGDGATAKIVTGGSGQITDIVLNHGGSGYGIGMTMMYLEVQNGVVR